MGSRRLARRRDGSIGELIALYYVIVCHLDLKMAVGILAHAFWCSIQNLQPMVLSLPIIFFYFVITSNLCVLINISLPSKYIQGLYPLAVT